VTIYLLQPLEAHHQGPWSSPILSTGSISQLCPDHHLIPYQSSRTVSPKLEVPLSLGTKQPALVGVGIRCRAKPADVATFLNRGRGAFQAVAPNGECCEDPQLRTSKEATLRLNGRRDSEHSHRSAAAKSSGTERAVPKYHSPRLLPRSFKILETLPSADDNVGSRCSLSRWQDREHNGKRNIYADARFSLL
jgi:hypothetical protein